MMRPAFSLLACGWLLASVAGAAEPQIVFTDRFEEKLGPGWTWLREQPAHWRMQNGALEICLQPGAADTVKNALLRPAPDRAKRAYAIEVTVTQTVPPTQQFEQAGLTWYQGGKPVFKLVHELVDGQPCIIPGRKSTTTRTMQLRLIVTADAYIAQYRPDAQGEYQTAARGALAPGQDEQISLQGYHGPPDAAHWIRFDDFRISTWEE